MNICIISDLHLCQENKYITEGFKFFIEKIAIKYDTLYILGDFFDYWIGDDAMNDYHHYIATILKNYTNLGKKLLFMVGNRDFSIGSKFLKIINATALKDPSIVNLLVPTILTHGDILCTDDINHQRFRKIIQNPLIIKLLLMLPVNFRKNLAMRIRSKSQRKNEKKLPEIMDVNQETIQKLMQKYQCQQIIHGHTHKPKHHINLPYKNGQRISLGDWKNDHGWFIEIQNSIKLKKFYYNN